MVGDAFVLPSHWPPATECVWNDHLVVGVLDADCDDSCSWSVATESKSASSDAVYDLLGAVVGFPYVKVVEDIPEVVGSGEWVVALLAPSLVVAWLAVPHP